LADGGVVMFGAVIGGIIFEGFGQNINCFVDAVVLDLD